jgi:hypothetical protein
MHVRHNHLTPLANTADRWGRILEKIKAISAISRQTTPPFGDYGHLQ